jgi:hypothetical protein
MNTSAATRRSARAKSKELPDVANKTEVEPKTSNDQFPSPDLKAHEIIPVGANTEECQILLEYNKIYEIAAAIYLPEGMSDAARNAAILRACQLYQSLDPQSGVESMLAIQMVNTHFATLESDRGAANTTPEARDRNLRQATSLKSLFIRQATAREVLRGKAQPQVAIGTLNVTEGGQAMVGNFDMSGGAGRRQDIPEAPMFDVTPDKYDDQDESRGAAD